MDEQSLANRNNFLKNYDFSSKHELVSRALDDLCQLMDADFYFRKGEEHRVRNSIELAISYYERALKIDEEHEDSLFAMGYCYLGEMDRNTGVYLDDDVTLEYSIRDQLAEKAFKKLIEIRKRDENLCPETYAAHFNLGIALYNQKKLNEALDNFYLSLEFRKDYASAYHMLALTKWSMGVYKEAEKDCRRALEIEERNERIYNTLGLIQYSMGQRNEAIKSYRRSIEINPFYTFPYIHLNRIFAEERNYDDAVETIEKALSFNPEYPDFYYYLAITYDELQMERKAVENYTTFLEKVNRRSQHFKDHIASAQRRLGELREELPDY
jgi:tetratricopeptide (TPR) repeat protein